MVRKGIFSFAQKETDAERRCRLINHAIGIIVTLATRIC